MSWHQKLAGLLPLLGHRNWIVVADSAYPLQAREGLVTLQAEGGHAEVLKQTVELVKAAPHVRPVALMDRELALIDGLCPEASDLRDEIRSVLKGVSREELLHEEILRMMGEAAQLYTIVVVKTDSRVPYSSVFLRLECGYWSDKDEAALRAPASSRDGGQ